jgi:hypothetical protein
VIPAIAWSDGWEIGDRPIVHLLDIDTLLRALGNQRGLIRIKFAIEDEDIHDEAAWNEEGWEEDQIGVVWEQDRWYPLSRDLDEEDDGVRYFPTYTQLSWDSPAMHSRHSVYPDKYHAALRNAINLLAELMTDSERQDKWDDIFRGWDER